MAISNDLIIILLIIGAFASFGFLLGKRRLLALILSFYFGLIFYFNFPYLKNVLEAVPNQADFWGILGIFVFFTVIAFFVLNRLISAEYSFGLLKFGELGILSIVGAGLLLTLLINVFSITKIYSFSESISQLFAFKNALFWWLAGSVLVIGFLSKK